MINEEPSNLFKNMFLITYKEKIEDINPPGNYYKLLNMIITKFNINEDEKEFLQIYQDNTLIDENNYLNLSKFNNFFTNLKVINLKDKFLKRNNNNEINNNFNYNIENNILMKIDEIIEKKFKKLEENLEKKINEKYEDIKKEIYNTNQKIVLKIDNIEKKIEKMNNPSEQINIISKQLKILNKIIESSLNEKNINKIENKSNEQKNINKNFINTNRDFKSKVFIPSNYNSKVDIFDNEYNNNNNDNNNNNNKTFYEKNSESKKLKNNKTNINNKNNINNKFSITIDNKKKQIEKDINLNHEKNVIYTTEKNLKRNNFKSYNNFENIK